MVKKCAYRNCDKDISQMRKNSNYCCRRHKEIEYSKKNGYSKNSKTFDILGIEYDKFKIFIENQFLEGMTWKKPWFMAFGP